MSVSEVRAGSSGVDRDEVSSTDVPPGESPSGGSPGAPLRAIDFRKTIVDNLTAPEAFIDAKQRVDDLIFAGQAVAAPDRYRAAEARADATLRPWMEEHEVGPIIGREHLSQIFSLDEVLHEDEDGNEVTRYDFVADETAMGIDPIDFLIALVDAREQRTIAWLMALVTSWDEYLAKLGALWGKARLHRERLARKAAIELFTRAKVRMCAAPDCDHGMSVFTHANQARYCSKACAARDRKQRERVAGSKTARKAPGE